MNVFRTGVLALALLMGSTSALGQEADDVDHSSDQDSLDDDAQARVLFHAGKTAYDEGRFESALEYFRNSYEFSGRPKLLFNIGSAADRLNRDEEAVTALNQYLDEVPDAKNRSSVERRIELINARIEKKRQLASRSIVVPVVLIGLGVAVVVAGATFLGIALSDKNTLEGFEASDMPRWSQHSARAERVPTFSTIGLIGIGVGVLTAGLGAMLFVTSKSKQTLQVSFGLNHLALRGVF